MSFFLSLSSLSLWLHLFSSCGAGTHKARPHLEVINIPTHHKFIVISPGLIYLMTAFKEGVY